MHLFAYGEQASRKRKPEGDPDAGPSNKKERDEERTANVVSQKAREWKSFWVPQLQATAESGPVEKPVSSGLCFHH